MNKQHTTKSKLPRRQFLLVATVAAATLFFGNSSFAGKPSSKIVVACVGDSITAGYGLSNPGADSYPAQLQAILGSAYSVQNYGLSGATVLKQSDYTYWNTSAYRNSTRSNPNIVVIMFGTNDSKAWNWNAANFDSDYRALISTYQNLRSQPTVYICLIPPAYLPNAFGNTFDPTFIQNTVVPAISNVAAEAGVGLIDNNTPLLNHPELFSDGIHPTAQGANIIANNVANGL
jgi:lysophospholipase L1-like esterase